MGGGLMQLVAYGAQDLYLTGNPQITFWKNLYRRHTNAAMESIEATFTGSADFGKRVNCPISRMGDLAHKMYVKIKLPQVTITGPAVGTAEFRWLDHIGHVLLKAVDIEIGGQRIDRHYSEWYHIYNQLNLPTGLKDGYNRMIGNIPELTELKVVKAQETLTIPSYTLWVPLQFWFNRNPGLALPLIALQYHEVRITVDFRDKEECYYFNQQTNQKNGSITMGSLDASLYIDYVYLDTDERKKFAQAAHEYLVEQLQYTGEESLQGSQGKVKLSLNHPVKELIWVLQKDEWLTNTGAKVVVPTSATSPGTPGVQVNVTPPYDQDQLINYYKGRQHFNFTTDWDDKYIDNLFFTSNVDVTTAIVGETVRSQNASVPRTVRGNPLVRCRLQLNSQDRLNEREGSYFDLVQPYQHHDNVPAERGINIYSFALRPADQQPSGSCNFSRIDNATIILSTPDKYQGKIKVFAVNYNVIRVISGIIEPTLQSLYQNQTVRPDRIELNLPNVFRRDNSTFTASDVARFAGLPYVAVHRINDVGPISKFAPTLSRYASKPKTIIIVVDDDTLYPPDLVERLVAGATQHPEAIVTAHCTNHYTLNDTPCDLVEGFKSYLLRPAHFRPSFWAFLAAALESDECYRADDFVLSAYIHTAKVPLLRLDAPAPLKTPQLSYGFEGDALHRQQPLEDPQTRYCGCFLHLQEKLPVSLGLRARCAQTQFEH
ncbi:hypothetical protein HXX76_014083 [Chlamydomonas incerta]|uniref:Uncharacterized protein n=1 Tax=Chlamydomonas incerta TaxID=51695 RepID=A0A835SQV6_CHLIN|nr:hypothetical protein HXX76_014083 [Chlamydomonas incerta]|eukprot:KAG2424925.1 hypothetical protein HXX76_014083 [Chlamydomonas incerta]